MLVCQTLHADHLRVAAAALREVADKVPQRFEPIAYGEIEVTPVIAASGEPMAAYSPARDRLYLSAAACATVEECSHILLHELGHRFAYRFSARIWYWKFLKMSAKPGMAVSAYGATSPEENFAEAFALYVLGRDFPPGTEPLRAMIDSA